MTETATERDYETTVLEAARLGGWRAHAERPARSGKGWRTPIRGDAGWPDLVLVRPPQILALELKRRPRRPTPEQDGWLLDLALCGVDARLVYVPEDLDALCAELVRRRKDAP